MTISLLSKKSVFLLATVATFSQQVMAVTAPPLHANITQSLALLPSGNSSSVIVAQHAVPPQKNPTIVWQKNPQQLRSPASTQKLLTALAAKLYLPSAFTFNTDIELSTNNAKQDLIIRFNGDPLFSRKDLTALLRKVKLQGINRLEGNIYLDGSIFNGYERAVGWPWDILGVCYSAPSSSISLEHNCVQGAIYSNKKEGQPTRVHVPSHQPITVTTQANIVSKAQKKSQFCDLELHALPDNSYQLNGCLLQREKPLPLNFAVQDTEAFTQQVLLAELKRLGIRFTGEIKRSDDHQGQRIARHQSVPLPELLEIMLKDSDNLIADNLAKTLGHYYFKQPGNFANGTAAIKAILSDQAGIDLKNAVLVDGSGLSRNNRLTAEQLLYVMNYLITHDQQLALLAALPVANESGTLRYRPSLRKLPLAGNLTAKSGSLYGAYNLAGVLKTKSGQSLIVIQLINNYHPVKPSEDKPMTPAITQFEKAFYEVLYHADLGATDTKAL
ncbi:serine-type D-Ala-D-Ala carboxypeptidase [Photobacterium sanguinicancri]|uniref:serine-type D-Ala-D-Ala carboxypeptidase n=1 Tax=Photobacterium sanguinicancri TaxID=875932 RepID=UPI0026E17F37|nr:serine-type D-Ala-D-Ala carboxypeptidase [Photobacterium sanguinicancri]MDO6497790.1 serine-type D-Ala-D-Ala carboxypeptidase [Photobacterium sanguinicancri]